MGRGGGRSVDVEIRPADCRGLVKQVNGYAGLKERAASPRRLAEHPATPWMADGGRGGAASRPAGRAALGQPSG